MKILKTLVLLLLVVTVTFYTTEPVLATPEQTEEKTEEEKRKEEEEKAKKAVYEMPVQTNQLTGWPQGPGTYGTAAIVMEAETGAILYAKNIDGKEYPASITKVLTALLAYEYGNMDSTVLITAESLSCLGSGYATIGLKEGNQISMDQAMHAMLMASSNEVAYAIAETVGKENGQDYNWFLQKMNEKTMELGGTNSSFQNTNGVHCEDHYTCAKDMALIGKELFQYPAFFDICQTPQYVIEASPTTEQHVFQQKHDMLIEGNQDYYAAAIGGKTGYTTEAKNTLITMADNGEMKLVCVVLQTYSGHIYPDTRALFDYCFANFKKVPIAEYETEEAIEKMPEDAALYLPESVSFDQLSKVIENGKISYYYEGHPVGTIEVETTALSDSKKIVIESPAETAEKEGENGSIWPVVGVLAGIVVFAGVWVQLLIKRERHRKEKRRKQRKSKEILDL